MLSFTKNLVSQIVVSVIHFGDVFRNSVDLCFSLFLPKLKGSVHSNVSLPFESGEKFIGYKESLGIDHSLNFYQLLPVFLFSQKTIISHPVILLSSLSKKVAMMSHF